MSRFDNNSSADQKAWMFLALSIGVLLLNFVSQIAAFPLQLALITYGISRRDVRYVPGVFISILDRANFFSYGMLGYLKINIGFSISVQNYAIIFAFLYVWFQMFRGMFDARTRRMFFPWAIAFIPALAMAFLAKSDNVSSWQEPIVLCLVPAYYFWGVLIAASWSEGRIFFIRSMIGVLAILNIMEFFGVFRIFTFAECVSVICLVLGCRQIAIGIFWRILGYAGAVFAIMNTLLGRYFRVLEETGAAGSAELGSTFTRVMVVVIGAFLCVQFSRKIIRGIQIKMVPILLFVICSIVFAVSVSLAEKGEGVYNDYQTLGERFKHKLIGDRGILWRESLEHIFDSPLIVKRMKDFETVYRVYDEYGGAEMRIGIMTLPHNEILTALVRYGWGVGLFQVLFLGWACLRACHGMAFFRGGAAESAMLLAPYLGVFFADGLTGQSLMSPVFCGNGFVTVMYPGLIYGIWLYQNKLRQMGGDHAYFMA